jgi:mannose-6-phosphate isomerase-like protein (cupin superfamily)
MATQLDGGCRVSDMREGDPVVNGTLRIWNQIGRATGAQAISLRIMEFAPGLSPGIRSGSDQILYVLDESWSSAPANDPKDVEDSSHEQAQSGPPVDQVAMIDSRPEAVRRTSPSSQVMIDGQSYGIGRDTGIYIPPSETFAVDNAGPKSIVIVSSQCPEPYASQFIMPLTTPATDLIPPEPPRLVRLADRPAQPTADRWYRVLVDDEVGSTQATQFVGSIPPGRAPDHFHKYEEVLFILKGHGRMWAGETNTPIRAGSCIYLPKGQVHCVENTGTDELRLLGVFYPAGSPSVRYEAPARNEL